MEKSVLSIIADNKALFDAVKEVFNKQFDVNTKWLSQLPHLSNLEIGELVKAQIIGLKAVEDGFKEIELCKSQREEVEEPMKGR
jgi:hypothetical protein